MPQFAPGEVKSARAPITVLPSGLSCSAELYLVSNTTKVATSGIKLFTSTGVKQDIRLPLTMPDGGTYPVWLDIFAEGLLIGAYKAVEDVVIAVPALELVVGDLTIFSIDGKGFTEVGIDADGVPYGVLSSPKVVSVYSNAVSWSLHWKTTRELHFHPEEPGRFNFELSIAPGMPVSRGTSGSLIGSDRIWEGYTVVSMVLADSTRVSGLYDGEWEWRLWIGDSRMGPRDFRVKNMLRIT